MMMNILLHFSIISIGIAFLTVMLRVGISSEMPLRKYLGVGTLVAIYLMVLLFEVLFGDDLYRKSYPLTVQMPLLMAFVLLCSYQVKKVVFAFVTTLTMMGFPVLIIHNLSVYMEVPGILRIIIVLFLGGMLTYCTNRWLVEDVHFVFENHDRMWWLYTIIPVVFWIATYAQQQYVMDVNYTLQFRYINIVLWLVVQLSYLLVFALFRTLHNLHKEESKLRELAVQQESVQQGIKQMYYANEQSKIFRHDMRHHFLALNGYLKENKVEQARAYITNVMNGIHDITPTYYCDCEMLNLVLSSFVSVAQNKGITLSIKAFVGELVQMEDNELCVLISNALENAIHAAEKIEDLENKNIYVHILNENGNLKIEVNNPFADKVIFKNNLPVRSKNGHGFGVVSIVSVVNKHHGLYEFFTSKNRFYLKIVI